MEIRHVMGGQATIDRLLAEPVARAWYVRSREPMVFLLTEPGSLFGGYESLASTLVEIQGDWRDADDQEIIDAIGWFFPQLVRVEEIKPESVHTLTACMN